MSFDLLPAYLLCRHGPPRKLEGIRNSKLANSSMFSHAATRTTTTLVSRRAFHATRARMSSPYHYPDGAYSNLPFNPHSKWFTLGYWGFMATGFFAPFGIAVYQTYKSAP
ncbi:cytochrome-c oxidase chain VIIc [Cordyceps militaris CM01]|uniref:Cytochrome c oxidase subunit 8, mitochondrial n=1 Tax=Cordyceps militaris (strain CM01) TaxID=983644 RepID=G3J843_CORMM|nr:cytochrome-c oxidase chain VIIc [Cordyceps militaris CM01]EGX93885.1 cytochrome-c oxidase chain VIIc [Cordyceps militaris CM01]